MSNIELGGKSKPTSYDSRNSFHVVDIEAVQ